MTNYTFIAISYSSTPTSSFNCSKSVNYNYFEFSSFIFQHTTGTAMGAAFSPTIANIFMSVTLMIPLYSTPPAETLHR